MSKATLTRTDGSLQYSGEEVIGAKKVELSYLDVDYPVNDFNNMSDESVKKTPWYKMTEEVDENGNVWISIPAFATQYILDSDGNITGRKISTETIGAEGWFLNPVFGTPKNPKGIQVAKYLLDEDYCSKAGKMPYGNKKYPSIVRNNLKAKYGNDDKYSYFLFDYWTLMALQDLALVEFAESSTGEIMESITISNIRNGLADDARLCGAADAVKAYRNNGEEVLASGVAKMSHVTDSGIYAMKYRGIEHAWGNGYLFVDGIYFNGENVYICKDIINYGDYKTYETVDVIRPLNNTGEVHKLKFDTSNLVVFPSEIKVGGSYQDSYEANANGDRALFLGSSLYSYNCSMATEGTYSGADYDVFRMVRRQK